MSYADRLKKARQIFLENGADALLVENPVQLFYLTGVHLSAGKLLLTSMDARLLVDGRYLELCQQHSSVSVELYDSAKFADRLLKPPFQSLRALAFESTFTSHHAYLLLKKQLEALPRQIELLPLGAQLSALRALKEPEEIAKLRAAAQLGSSGFDFLCSILQEGISELEAAVQLEIFWKERGGRTVAFDPIIAFGSHSSMPHYRAGEKRLRLGDNALIDIGVTLDDYHSDMTRVLFCGPPDPQLLAIYEIVQQAQAAAISLCRPGTALGALDAAARTLIAEKGYGAHFTHSLGHGIGLEVHEYPTIRNAHPYKDVLLTPGMVLTIEPGIYLPGLGGVRLEDTILITDTGHINLTERPIPSLTIHK
jgi:Xaa-Pro aminopeptidase